MKFFSRFAPFSALRDLRLFLSQRQPYELGFLFLAVVITTLLIAGFARDSKVEKPYKRNIIYAESWPANRTDAQIIAQQKIDGVEEARLKAENDKRLAANRARFKKLDDRLSKWGL